MTASSKPRRLRLVSEETLGSAPNRPSAGALRYTNRRGVTFYLHQGRTKTGKPRYFVAKTIEVAALVTMPAGFEFVESINGVVSIRRVDTTPKLIPDTDVEAVRAEVARHHHLRYHRVEARKEEVVIYEPVGPFSAREMEHTARELGIATPLLERRIVDQARMRYTPVMKFVAEALGKSGDYVVQRMTYSGPGGWHYLTHGPLPRLVRKFVRHIGTEQFFELL